MDSAKFKPSPSNRLDRRSFLRKTSAWTIAAPLGAGHFIFAPATNREICDVGLTAQLFLDEWCVEKLKGLARRLHTPTKVGLIQEADGRPWELGDQIGVVRDAAGRFHMTYRFIYWDPSVRDLHPSIGEDKAHWYRLPTAYATSADGIRWMKPVLGLVDGPTGFRAAPQSKWKDGVFWEPTGISRQNNLGCPIHIIQDLPNFSLNN